MHRAPWILGSVLAATMTYAAGVLTDLSSWTGRSETVRASLPSSRHIGSSADLPGSSQYKPADHDVPRRIDLRGNEISRPVARYRLDESGVLYEVHSPETEVPRLKPPKL